MNNLPSGWDVKRIKEICFIGRGRVISEKEIQQNPGDYPVYSSQTTNKGEIGRINTYDFEGEYVTWTTDGANAGTVFYRNGKFNCTNVCGTLKAKKDNIDHKFLAYQLSTIAKKYVSYVGNPKLMNNVMAEIKIPLPNFLNEQQKIAEILSEIDRNIELTKKVIEKEKRIKKGLMQDLLRYGIDEKGNIRNPKTHKFKNSELGLIPEEWEIKKINQVCDILDNYRIPLNEEERQQRKGNIPYYGANGIIDFIDDYIFDDELILLPEDGGDFENYKTKPIAYKVIGKCWVNNHAHVLKVKSTFNYDYIFYTLEHKDITYYISGGTRTKLNKSDLIKIKIPLPKSLEEQQKIAKILSLQDEKIEKLNKKLNKLKKIKKALMQDLLTGKVRVTKLLKDKK